MQHPWIPDWIVNAVYYAYKFVLGAFGRDISPPPYQFKICGPFWISLLALTVGLPIVLLAWSIRLVFDKGRAKRLGDFLVRHDKKITKFFITAFILVLFAGIIWSGDRGFFLLTVGGGILFIAVVIGIILVLLNLVEGYVVPKLEQASVEKRKAGFLIKTLKAVTLPFVMLLKAVLHTIRFIALMVHAAVNKYCPIVEKA